MGDLVNIKWNVVGGWGDFLPAIVKSGGWGNFLPAIVKSGGWGDFFPTSVKSWQIGIHRVRKSTTLGSILLGPNY